MAVEAAPAQSGEEQYPREGHMQSLAGTMWKLVEALAFDDAGGELPPPFGPQPMGFVIFETERTLGAICDGRTSRSPDPSSRGFIAYCGTYSFDGAVLVTHADGASEPELIVDQVRNIRFESPTRMVATPVSDLPNQSSRLETVWERVG